MIDQTTHKAIKSALTTVVSRSQPISPNNAVSEACKIQPMSHSAGRSAILGLLDSGIFELTATLQLKINSRNLDWNI